MPRIIVVLVSLIWLTSAVSNGNATPVLELRTSPPVVVAQCGETVTLTCNASSSNQFHIIKAMWLGANVSYMCPSQDPDIGAGGLCERKADSLNKYSFTLTLANMMPVNQGQYICKLYSSSGIENSITYVTVQGGKYLVHKEVQSSGCRLSLQWICFVLGLLKLT
ncbi:uncharacterized protein LOC142992495 isoform X2 [Genypterus blacodes]|uniref:uncharacterized protein LOC142992495 isoform X2 n=1 Tax=Genypterus blacodes TaxID=154954 RepID=UPI003F759D86